MATPRFTDEEIGELLDLISDADSVELKLTVPESAHMSAVAALGMDPLDAQIRQVYFFDTPDLTLNRNGVQRKGGDAIVKLRPVVPHEVPNGLRGQEGFTIEVDAMPGGYVCSGTLKQAVRNSHVHEVVAGTRSLGALFSKGQRRLLSDHAPDGVGLADLSVLGPVFVLKLKFEPEGFARRLVAELWMYPDGSRVLELSTKCEPREAFLAAAEARAFLSRRGVDLSGEQEAKTAKALDFFAGRLRRGRASLT
jgi:hypothetical protein